MPEFIDPAWEYWTPDPEIEECMRNEQAERMLNHGNPFASVIEFTDGKGSHVQHAGRGSNSKIALGLRFGRGNPDWFVAKFKVPESAVIYGRKNGKPEPLPTAWKDCENCKERFQEMRNGQRFCSKDCATGHSKKGHPRWLRRCMYEFLHWLTEGKVTSCPVCSGPVLPSRKNQTKIYCSILCAQVFHQRIQAAKQR